MNGKTPGQVVYETGHRGYTEDEDWSPIPWPKLTDEERDDWEAAARAATVTAWRLLDEARAECDRLRALVRQALEDAGVPDDVQAEWLDRAGLDG